MLTKLKWIVLCLISTALTLAVSATIQADDFSAQQHLSNSLNHGKSDRPIIIVSTMDGKVSALDESDGRLLWSVDAGIGPLVSSSITEIKINEDGKVIRLIPSLSGGLFKFDGISVEALPYSADYFLSTSFKAPDGSILVGDNEVTTFGVDATTGRMLYYCTAAGCDTMGQAHSNAPVIVMKRHQKTVRSVDNRNGDEKWNFSVGELHLEVSEGASQQLIPVSLPTASKNKPEKINEVPTGSSESEYDDFVTSGEQDELKFLPKKFRMQVSVPDGVISLFAVDSKDGPKWKHKFSSSVASMWRVDGGQFHKIDLFDPRNVPALSQKRRASKISPAIYLGHFDGYAYVQVSRILEKASGSAISLITNQHSGYKSSVHHPVKFDFLPYLAKSDQLTAAEVGEAKEGDLAVYDKSVTNGNCNDKLGVFIDQSTAATDMGYYLMSNIPYQYSLLPPSERKGKMTEINSDDDFFEFPIDVISPHLRLWWKEVLVISALVMSVLVHLLFTKFIKTSTTYQAKHMEAKTVATTPVAVIKSDPDIAAQYKSRYQQDFDPVRCLGKGGFGIVLESRNKVDNCSYAIKRILLPNKESAREKVLREVRVLAKLNHNCIVRYYNAWIEEPPAGWQEKVDEGIISEVSAVSASGGFSYSQAASKSTLAKHSEHEIESRVNPSDDLGIYHGGAFLEESRPFSLANAEEYQCVTFSEFSGTSRAEMGFVSSPSSNETASGGDQSVPFGRYAGADDSLSIVFENTRAQASTSSRDSAFEEDAVDKDAYQTPKNKTGRRGCVKRRVTPQMSATRTDDLPCIAPPQSRDAVSSAPEVVAADKLENVYLYIQMELCQKESLRAWLAANYQRGDRYCLEVFKQVLSAVDYIHGRNLIHRDLKPSNIFFSSDGSIKVGDFGLVTETDEIYNKDSPSVESTPWDYLPNESHTQKVGTKLYMAPEQLNSRSYSWKVDIFPLGLILIELFTRFSTQMERINVLTRSRKRNFDENFKAAYPSQADLARNMLSQKPERRPSASEAMQHGVFSVPGVPT